MAASTSPILVPYNRSRSSQRALEIAFGLARNDKTLRVQAVYVVEVDRRYALEAEFPQASQEGERCLAEAEEMARKYKSKCDGQILQAREAGHAIVDEAVEMGARAIILGAPRKSAEGQALDLGATADFVLRHAPCEVVLVMAEEGA